jgi:hypothetical protein
MQSASYVALNQSVTQLGTQRYWPYPAIGKTNEFQHIYLCEIMSSGLTSVFSSEFREKLDFGFYSM